MGIRERTVQYSDMFTHRLLVRDSTRTETFRQAVQIAVNRGDAVLDVGAGCGILSLFAARAGARRVYAVEITPAARLARHIVRRNRLHRVIRVIEAPIEAATLPEPVDVILAEWIGTIGVDENLLGLVLLARDRWLKPGGSMVPRQVTAWMAPARVPMRPDAAFFINRPYGLDLSPLAEPSIHELLGYRRRVLPNDLAAPPLQMWTTDVARMSARYAALPALASLEFVVRDRATVNCLAAWFSAELAEGVCLTNAPEAADTHWGQLVLPLARERVAAAGDVIAVRVACIPAEPERSDFAWSVRIGAGSWEHHDTRATPGRRPGWDDRLIFSGMC
jgi:SAM-dependent methyltransferase